MAAVIGAVVGGGGIVGLVFYFIRSYIDKKLSVREQETKKRRDLQIRRLKIENEMEHATGRLFFWMHKAVTTGKFNGDLDAAWEKYRAAEEKKKELDREILVQSEME